MTHKLTIVFALSSVVFLSACPKKNKITDRPVGVDGSREPMQMVMFNYTFHPATLNVPTGKDVIFTNKDAERHCLRIEGADVSQDIEPNETFSHVFSTAGTYEVSSSCDPPRMKATIVVE